MNNKIVACALIVCLTLQACSSKPREFTPALASAPASAGDFDAAHATCHHLLVAGKLDSNGRSASGSAGAAVGVGTAAVGGTAAATAGGYAGLAAASATVVLLPFAILGGAWGMAKMKRAKKERAIKTALEGCLDERGYRVAGWSEGAKKKKDARPPAK
jgi:hypothetical protein